MALIIDTILCLAKYNGVLYSIEFVLAQIQNHPSEHTGYQLPGPLRNMYPFNMLLHILDAE